MRAGEGAFHGAEQLAFDQFARQGGAVDLDDLALAARAEGVDEVGNHFLAGAALAGDQHGDVAGRDALDGADDLAHGGALEDRRGGAAHGFEGAPQHAGFFGLLPALQRVVHVGQEFLEIELRRFPDEVEGAPFGRLDRPGQRLLVVGRAGQNDDLGLRPALLDGRQQVESVAVGQFDVQQHHVRLFLRERLFQRCLAVSLGDDVVVFECAPEQLAEVRQVIYD